MSTGRAHAPRGQLRPLRRLRWAMVRHPAARIGLLVLMLVLMLVLVGTALSGPYAPPQVADEFGLLLPTVLLAFAVMCAIAPLTAGGGFELLPAEHLVAFPIRSRTLFSASVLLTPLNLAWMMQVLALVALVAWRFGSTDLPLPAFVVLAAYVLMATVVGHSLAWWVSGVRRRRAGRWATWAAAAAAVGACAAVAFAGRITDLLDRSPTVSVAIGMVRGEEGSWPEWLLRTAGLVLVTGLAWLLGARACSWSLRRPGDASAADRADRVVRRRTSARSLARELAAVDRASVWRSAPLRRGLLVLVLLPAAAALVAGMPWVSIVMLPPLLASGAALLFGVNAFCLDGSGAFFLASAPVDPALLLRSKMAVVTEVVLLAVLTSVVVASLRAGIPSAVELAAVVGSAVSCCAVVVGTCMRLSVERPHRADLRGPRDTPAPPGTMAIYSLRLALTATPIGLLFSILTLADQAWPAVLTTVAVVALAARSLRRSTRRWSDPHVRARVVATVAAG